MEADFGFDIYSGLDQYGDHSERLSDCSDIDTTVYPRGCVDSEEGEDDEEGGEAGMIDVGVDNSLSLRSGDTDRSSSNTVKRKGKPSMCGLTVARKRKRDRSGHTSPVYMFYRQLLGWDVSSLRNDSRRSLGLGSLAPFSPSFESPRQFFEAVCATALEECRASVVSALMELTSGRVSTASGGSVTTLSVRNAEDLLDEDFGCAAGDLVGLDCALVSESSVARNQLRPGCVLLLTLSGEKHRSKGAQFRHEDWFLGSFRQQAASMDFLGGGSSCRSVPVWVCRQHFRTAHCQAAFSCAEQAPLYLHCIVLCSVISYQRVCTTCYDEPSPPFLRQLLGM